MKYVCLVSLFMLGLMAACSSGPGRGSASGGSVAAAQAAQAKVIDVRTPEEYEIGHVKGATNIPVDQIETRIASIVPDKSTPLMVHCQSGRRSARAKATLDKLGYTQVTDLGSLANARKVVEGN